MRLDIQYRFSRHMLVRGHATHPKHLLLADNVNSAANIEYALTGNSERLHASFAALVHRLPWEPV